MLARLSLAAFAVRVRLPVAVSVRASDNAGNGGSQASVVTVPHDQGD